MIPPRLFDLWLRAQMTALTASLQFWPAVFAEANKVPFTKVARA